MNEVDKERIRHILEHYEELNEYIKGLTFEEISKNKMRFQAIQMNVLTIGEYIIQLPDRVKNYIGKQDVSRIKQIRNRLAHEYDSYEVENLEDTIYIAIPNIIKQLKKLMEKNYYEY